MNIILDDMRIWEEVCNNKESFMKYYWDKNRLQFIQIEIENCNINNHKETSIRNFPPSKSIKSSENHHKLFTINHDSKINWIGILKEFSFSNQTSPLNWCHENKAINRNPQSIYHCFPCRSFVFDYFKLNEKNIPNITQAMFYKACNFDFTLFSHFKQ